MADNDLRSRITRSAQVDPRELTANPKNWRQHPKEQRVALEAILDEVGWITGVTVNERTGLVVDGHLRLEVALSRKLKTIPVDYVDLTEEEEALALATMDPITAMAKPNGYLFAQLLEQANTGNADLMAYLDEVAQRVGAVEAEPREPKQGAKEYSAGDFDDFDHQCPECGFQFDE